MIKEYVLKENEILAINADRIFKDMFNEYEMDTIEWLVMKILDCKYEDIHGKVKVGGTESPGLAKDDKGKRLDLVVYYKNQVFDIELNCNTGLDFTRNSYYIANRVINSRLIGETYEEKVQGILVNLNWYRHEEDANMLDDIIETTWEYPSFENDKPDYFIKFINVNLDAWSKVCYNKVEKKDLVWKLFTIKDKKELDDLVSKEKLLSNYRQKLTRLSKDEEYCRMIWDERIEENLRKHEEYVNGKHDGKIEGKIEQRNKIIINMYNHGDDLKYIASIAETTVEEVQDVINNNTNESNSTNS